MKLRYVDYMGTGVIDETFELQLLSSVAPYYGNTHSDSLCSKVTSALIEESRNIIKSSFVNKNSLDKYRVIFTGQGMTGAARHFAYLLNEKKITFIICTVLEHLSNSVLWESLFSEAKTTYIKTCSKDSTCFHLDMFKHVINKPCKKLKENEYVLVALTACSNVFGSIQPVRDSLNYARTKLKNNVILCVDCAACAPYISLIPLLNDTFDAAFASPHKFQGGQSTPGILVVEKSIINSKQVPFFPGGGTVWYKDMKCSKFIEHDENREEGGSQNMMGIIRAGLLFNRKNKKLKFISKKNQSIINHADSLFLEFNMKGLTMLSSIGRNVTRRLPVYSFTVQDIQPSFFVQVLSDEYGIQARSGVSCCFMLANHICKLHSSERNKFKKGQGVPVNFGWIRLSFHYNNSLEFVYSVIQDTCTLVQRIHEFIGSYKHIPCKNEYKSLEHDEEQEIQELVSSLFKAIT
jgi:selenocysteine lyase/cysteine desulfurase